MTTTGKGVGTTLSDIPIKFQVQTVGCFREGRYSSKLTIANAKKTQLGGGFKDFLFLPLFGEDFQFD